MESKKKKRTFLDCEETYVSRDAQTTVVLGVESQALVSRDSPMFGPNEDAIFVNGLNFWAENVEIFRAKYPLPLLEVRTREAMDLLKVLRQLKVK